MNRRWTISRASGLARSPPDKNRLSYENLNNNNNNNNSDLCSCCSTKLGKSKRKVFM